MVYRAALTIGRSLVVVLYLVVAVVALRHSRENLLREAEP